MNSELTAFITLVCISGVLNLYLCLYVFLKRYKYKKIAAFFIIYTVSTTIYCFGSAFGLTAETLGQLKFWTTIQYIGLPFSAPLGLLFIMQYLGLNITKKRFIGFNIIPFISLIMVATNDLHHLHYRVFEIDPFLGAPYIHLEVGKWYVVNGVYMFACMLASFLLVLLRWKETAMIYRWQLIALLWGKMVPMLTSFLYLIGFTPPGIDPVPMILWITSLLYLWSISSSRMFMVMPIAKDAIFNSINDGVMVLDDCKRLIEFNQACQRMFPRLNKSMYGMELDTFWVEISEVSIPTSFQTSVRSQEIHLSNNESKRIYQARISPLQEANIGKGSLIIFTDITELKLLQVKLEYQAYNDELTQIFNRRAFFEKSEEMIGLAQKESLPFTVILMDIDHFKEVNDRYGHYVGDQLLVHVVKVCQAQLAEDILFARYGGEEFVLALQGYPAKESAIIANRIRKSVELRPLENADGVISVTISCGVAEVEENNSETLAQLLNRADKALYKAKRAGRNQVEIYKGNL
ncbi:diguanylate cyclase [Bacillus sp. JCM 19034]|uniref:histidine kinase N-terminal 7TM domain-containing diguanylate cyclase n=1 Tax=Bacillus sp. JCM 19034 TaxID=1481928 RepID=UPI0007844DAD|nr:diguanylate cyclase [Bacillus sp. JCM 19034]